MRILLPILTLVVTCFLTFNVPSWDTIKTGCSDFAEGFKEGFFNLKIALAPYKRYASAIHIFMF
ncbi:hypothetical protein ACT7DD_06505 [Bacillus paranthracis]